MSSKDEFDQLVEDLLSSSNKKAKVVVKEEYKTPPPLNTEIRLSDNGKEIFNRRYRLRDQDGNFTESIEETYMRVAHHVAKAEETSEAERYFTHKFYNLLTRLEFIPNAPTWTGAGTPLGQLAACFVLPIEDDMGSHPDGIFTTLRNAALIQQTGGGNGFSFSRLRPRGDLVNSSMGKATGPVGFLEVYDAAFGEIAQGGARRGANMAVLRVDHPDIRDYIACKAEEGRVKNFNISVAITDKFMEAVKNDGDFELINPRTKEVWEVVKAKELFDLIVEYAHRNGEPGILFIDEANRGNPVPNQYTLEATNPCGEQWLGPYENCCLGHVNLAVHVNNNGSIDWDYLAQTVHLGTRFLDDIVTMNGYVPAVAELKEAAHNNRRIGLGFTGLADVMYEMGIRYGSEEGAESTSEPFCILFL
jgi:ribonucleoside-diphosphate reductase alpha chain